MSNQKVIDRINEIIRKVSEENMGGRANRYIGSGLSKQKKNTYQMGSRSYAYLPTGDYNIYDEDTGNNYQISSMPEGGMIYDNKRGRLINQTAGNAVAGNMVAGAAPKRRKKRSDTGNPKITEWTNFVRAVSAAYGIPYNKALTQASLLRKQGYTIEDI